MKLAKLCLKHTGFINKISRLCSCFYYSLWLCIRFGLAHTSPAYQCFMTDCLVGLRDLVYIPYLNHVSRYGKTIDEPVANLRMVLWIKHIYIYRYKIPPRLFHTQFFTPIYCFCLNWDEQPLPGMELQEKKHKKDYRIQKICLERTYS